LYAGLIALVNAALGNAVGFINADLYALAGAPVFRDIADNRWNGYDGAPGYVSRIGWDACTGLGVIDGAALLQALV
jgi:kumamolisin